MNPYAMGIAARVRTKEERLPDEDARIDGVHALAERPQDGRVRSPRAKRVPVEEHVRPC